MAVLFEKRDKRETAVDIVVNTIKEMLVTRKLLPGDKLPTENEISEGLGVSRGSVREAMKILSAFGLVDIRVGNGTYVCDAPGNETLDSFLFSFFAINPNVRDLAEFRELIEVDIMELILAHRDSNDRSVEKMKALHNELAREAEKGISPERLLELDTSFHYAMAEASCNILAERVYRFTIDFLRPSIASTHEHQNGDIVYSVHQKILDVIDKNDRAGIKDTIRASVDTWTLRQPEA